MGPFSLIFKGDLGGVVESVAKDSGDQFCVRKEALVLALPHGH